MEYRKLCDGLDVSVVSLGTVELGMDYGIRADGQFGKPTMSEAAEIIETAISHGINLFDTAPGYGDSESILGELTGANEECYIATKVNVESSKDIKREIFESLESSMKRLKRKQLDIVQYHNPTVADMLESDMPACLQEAKEAGMVRFIGVSIYTEEEAIAAIDGGMFDMIQLPYNALDRVMEEAVTLAAARNGVGILNRSVYLKGALTPKVHDLPLSLESLKTAALTLTNDLNISVESLPEYALRFCLSNPGVSSALVGARTSSEVEAAATAAEKGGLTPKELEIIRSIPKFKNNVTDPRTWESA